MKLLCSQKHSRKADKSFFYQFGMQVEVIFINQCVVFQSLHHADHWYSGCFVWSQSASPVFTKEVEIAYLSAFTNSLMVEISRLDAIIANKMKSDFISSISRKLISVKYKAIMLTIHETSFEVPFTEFLRQPSSFRIQKQTLYKQS